MQQLRKSKKKKKSLQHTLLKSKTRPKSPNLQTSLKERKMFSDLISMWTRLWLCKCLTAWNKEIHVKMSVKENREKKRLYILKITLEMIYRVLELHFSHAKNSGEKKKKNSWITINKSTKYFQIRVSGILWFFSAKSYKL